MILRRVVNLVAAKNSLQDICTQFHLQRNARENSANKEKISMQKKFEK